MATIIRNAAAGYRPGMGNAGMMPAMAAGSPPMTGGGAPGLTISNLAGLKQLGGRSTPTRPPATRSRRFDSFAGLHLRPDDIPEGRWAEAIRAAIRNDLKGIHDPAARANWETGMMIVSGRESGHNPDAINNYDSNASDGNRSEGAFQFTPTTFAASHEPGTSASLRDPVAQASAFINYVQDRYGVLPDGSNLAARVQQADPTRPPKGY